MRRDRSRGGYGTNDNFKAVLLLAGGVLLVSIITFVVIFSTYNKKVGGEITSP